jgi:hypothetical protein
MEVRVTDTIPSNWANSSWDPAQQALVSLVVRGMVRGAPDDALNELVERGYALVKGPIIMPTPEGTAAAGELLRIASGSAEEGELNKLFDAFLPINRRLRDVCSAWQTRPDGTVNDHNDASYDDAVRERLDDVHSSIGPVLRRLGGVDESLSGYRPRLQAALDRFDHGENNWLASPLIDSYHTVWMHLHQQLILMLGLTRAEDEAREERLVSGHAG